MKNLIKYAALLAAISTLNLSHANDKSDWQEVAIKFPKPQFEGTPPFSIKLPNLEKAKKPVIKIKAPAGTKKLSRGKPVTASDDLPILGDLEYITDGDKDGSEGSFVELVPGTQWVQIDLEKSSEIYGIVVWHYHRKVRAYLDVIIQLSDDPAFKEGVTTLYNNDHDNSSGQGKGKDKTWIETNHGRVLQPEGKKARYIRLYSNGNTANEMNHYTEVEVYGR